MDKQTMIRLLLILPEDATEISIPNLDSTEVIFSSDMITPKTAPQLNALPAQRGTYRGSKKRWRIDGRPKSITAPQQTDGTELEGTVIDLNDIPLARDGD